jgi:hypothetical protein
MGVYTDAVLYYGIIFEYDEIEFLKNNEKFKILAENIGCEYMDNLWQEMGFLTNSLWNDPGERYTEYIIGVVLKTNMNMSDFLNQIDEEKVKKYIENTCSEYNLQYKEPKIFCKVDVN